MKKNILSPLFPLRSITPSAVYYIYLLGMPIRHKLFICLFGKRQLREICVFTSVADEKKN